MLTYNQLQGILSLIKTLQDRDSDPDNAIITTSIVLEDSESRKFIGCVEYEEGAWVFNPSTD